MQGVYAESHGLLCLSMKKVGAGVKKREYELSYSKNLLSLHLLRLMLVVLAGVGFVSGF